MKKKVIALTLLALLLLAACTKNSVKQSKNSHSTVKTIKVKKKKAKSDRIKQIIKKMSLSQKIGQLYFIHSTGNFSEMKREVAKYDLGGITLFAPDFQNRSQNQFLNQMKQYQLSSQHGLLIAADQEGGTVSRINSNPQISKRKYPSPQEVYQRAGLKGIQTEDSQVARILKINGINMNFAPVADVAKDKHSFIYARTLGENYQLTAKYIPVAVKAIQKQNVAATLKHFPGYGDAGDTHTGFAQINKSLADYEKEDLLPFKAGIQAGVDGIMVSHIIIKNLDNDYPASLSLKSHQLLRQKLDYHGLIITDDLQMGAITQFAKKHRLNADVLALKAGNDLLLGGDPQTGIPAIKQSVQKKQISEKQIDQSVYRILRLKEKLQILR